MTKRSSKLPARIRNLKVSLDKAKDRFFEKVADTQSKCLHAYVVEVPYKEGLYVTTPPTSACTNCGLAQCAWSGLLPTEADIVSYEALEKYLITPVLRDTSYFSCTDLKCGPYGKRLSANEVKAKLIT